jgi:hypothetical protein
MGDASGQSYFPFRHFPSITSVAGYEVVQVLAAQCVSLWREVLVGAEIVDPQFLGPGLREALLASNPLQAARSPRKKPRDREDHAGDAPLHRTEPSPTCALCLRIPTEPKDAASLSMSTIRRESVARAFDMQRRRSHRLLIIRRHKYSLPHDARGNKGW